MDFLKKEKLSDNYLISGFENDREKVDILGKPYS